MRQVLAILAILLCASMHSRSQNLNVHEWGTFTTLSGSNGTRLSGLVLEEEFLPGFVYEHDRYNATTHNKGFGLRALNNVTVKMETPVLYFYSDKEVDVNARVDFPNGTISQWYPQRSGGETLIDKDTLDFSSPFHGWIEWNATVLAPGSTEKLSAEPMMVTKTWSTPRLTDANLVRSAGNKEVEKYLFYRGLGNFDLPLTTSFASDGSMNIENNGSLNIPYIFVYELRDSLITNEEGKVVSTMPLASVWWSGQLDAHANINVNIQPFYHSPDSPDMKAQFAAFSDALVKAGLYRKEADAMLNTWSESYFHRSGVKVFWVVPREMTDNIIPMKISPTPSSIERVLVGRSEVLTPGFEKQIYSDLVVKSDPTKWLNDRYYYAYKERVAAMMNTGVTDPSIDALVDGIRVFPNPSKSSCTIQRTVESSEPMQISVLNSLGSRMIAVNANGSDAKLELSSLPSGLYILQVKCGDRVWVRSLVKQ